MDAEVYRLHRVGQNAPRTKTRAELADELLVFRALDALEIAPGRIMADAFLTQTAQIILADAERQDRRLLGADTGAAESAEERSIGVAVDRVEDQIRLTGLNRLDRLAHLGIPERDVFLADDFHFRKLAHLIAEDRMGRARKNVVRANQEKTALALQAQHVIECRDHLLIGSGPKINDVGR